MNEWYELVNDLETKTNEPDELTAKRIERNAAAALPKRRSRLKIALIAAAILLLTACGVTTLRFADWFGTLTNPQDPAASEDLLSSLGTVLAQTQTVDGVTMTLHGALYDGETFLLSLSVEGLEETRYSSSVDPGASWLYSSRAEWERGAEKAGIETSYYDQLIQSGMFTVNISRQFDMDRCLLLIRPVMMPKEGQEVVLHLEDLQVMGQTVSGPFTFTFTPEKKTVEQTYNCDVQLTAMSGEAYTVTQVVITPLEIRVQICGQLDSSGSPPENTPCIEDIRTAEGADSWAYGSGSWIQNGGDGTWVGRLTYGTLERILDPASVTAVKIDDTWLELHDGN